MVAAAALLLPGPHARAAEIVYQYHIEHPTYGDIGTYSNVIKNLGDHEEINTELHVAVKVLGIVVHREDAKRSELWQGNRLVRFDSATETNGTTVTIHGEAKGDEFVVTTPTGTITAPARVHPSNPWDAAVLDTDTMMSAKSGRIDKVTVTPGVVEQVKFDGKDMRLTRYDIVDNKRQSVWFDDRGTPVAFRAIEDGATIDFVLQIFPRTSPPTARRTSRPASARGSARPSARRVEL